MPAAPCATLCVPVQLPWAPTLPSPPTHTPALQFAHVLFCLELYLLLPFMRRYIRRASLAAHVAVTAAMVGAATALLLPLSAALAELFCALVLFTSLGCPAWLLRIQKFKAKINGPWDEAVPCLPGTIQWRAVAS